MKKSKNRMNKAIALVICMFAVQSLHAQVIELEQDVNADTVISNFGKNRKHYFSSYMGLGIVPTQIDSDSLQLKTGASTRFSFGLYYKYKISNFYSLVSSVNYGLSQFEFETTDPVKYNRLNVNDVNLEIANRFNFGKRGNRIGNYLELGISGDYVFHTKQSYKTTVDNSMVFHSKQKVINTGISYIEKPNYSAHARIGFNKIVITADYRLSDLTTNQVNFDLPPLAVGLRLDFGA